MALAQLDLYLQLLHWILLKLPTRKWLFKQQRCSTGQETGNEFCCTWYEHSLTVCFFFTRSSIERTPSSLKQASSPEECAVTKSPRGSGCHTPEVCQELENTNFSWVMLVV
jgi:hypothetical protein